MTQTNTQRATTKTITDQEAIEHLRKIDGKLKGKNNLTIFLIIVCLLSIAANVVQYLKITNMIQSIP